MTDEQKKKKRKSLIITPIIIIVLFVAGGILTYTQFLKKNTADLLDVIPADAAFVFHINDNTSFVKGITPCKTYLNELFSLEALAGFEYFADMSATKTEPNKPIVISGHATNNHTELLFAVKMDVSSFQHLIKQLKINPKNYITFETHKIFTAITHYHEFKITCLNGIFVAAESQPLLEQAIHQLAGRDCLRQSREFQPLYHVITKNDKQNWLILQHKKFIEIQQPHIDSTHFTALNAVATKSHCSAYVTRFSNNELLLSGYSTVATQPKEPHNNGTDEAFSIPSDLIPAAANYYVCHTQPVTYSLTATPTDTICSDFTTLTTHAGICFGMQVDTANYHYLLVPMPHELPDGCISTNAETTHRNIAIYRSHIPDLTTAFPTLNHEFPTTYAVQLHNYLLFTESIAAAKSYLDAVTANRILSANQHYRFTNASLPSYKEFEFFYINTNKHFSSYFTRSFLQKKPSVIALKVFAFNCQIAVNGLLPNTIYIKWDAQ